MRSILSVHHLPKKSSIRSASRRRIPCSIVKTLKRNNHDSISGSQKNPCEKSHSSEKMKDYDIATNAYLSIREKLSLLESQKNSTSDEIIRKLIHIIKEQNELSLYLISGKRSIPNSYPRLICEDNHKSDITQTSCSDFNKLPRFINSPFDILCLGGILFLAYYIIVPNICIH